MYLKPKFVLPMLLHGVLLQVFDKLDQANIVPSDISGLEDCFTRCHNLFVGLETKFNMIVSILHINFHGIYTCIVGAKRYSTGKTT